MNTINEKHVLDLMHCWHTHDLEGLMARISDNAVYTPDLISSPIRGREAIRKEWAGYIARMPTYATEVINILSSDDLVFLERKESFRFPEDRPMAINIIYFVGIFEFDKEGLVCAFRDYYDTSVYKAPRITPGN